jgi:hypothetical protein
MSHTYKILREFLLLCREPTPDQHHMYNSSSRQQRLLHSLRMRKRPRVRLREGEGRPEGEQEEDGEERTWVYLQFLNRVTSSILARGIYTDKGLREAIRYTRGAFRESLKGREGWVISLPILKRVVIYP